MNTGWDSHSEQLDAVAAAFVAAVGKLEDIKRDRTANAGTYSYKYADLGDALGHARPILAAEGLALTQSVTIESREVHVWTTVLHKSGQWFTTKPVSLPAGNTAQAAGSGITYARRYAAMATLGLATDDDDGAAAGTRETPPAPRKVTAPKRPANVTTDGEIVRPTSDALTKKVMAMFGELGVKDRAERLNITSDILGREVGSWKEVPMDEAKQVVDELARRLSDRGDDDEPRIDHEPMLAYDDEAGR